MDVREALGNDVECYVEERPAGRCLSGRSNSSSIKCHHPYIVERGARTSDRRNAINTFDIRGGRLAEDIATA